MRVDRPRLLKRAAWSVAVTGAAAATLVSAQPAPQPVQPATPISPPPAPGAPVAEEAPPINVPPPAPMVVPPISEKEVAPAAPPKAQVADTATVAPVVRRERYNVAILQALDKVTAETLRFEVQVGGAPVRYKNLIFTVRACERSAPDEPVEDSIAYITVDSQPRPERGKPTPPARQAFRGWMYASSPGLNALQHPSYDAWLINCRTTAPATPVGAAPTRPVAAAAPPVKAAPGPAGATPSSATHAAKSAATPPAKAPPAPKATPAPKVAPPVPPKLEPTPPAAPPASEEPIT